MKNLLGKGFGKKKFIVIDECNF